MTPTVSDEVQRLPLGLFAASPTQPRKRFKPEKLRELAASIEAHGVLEPILARVFPGWVEGNGQPPLEIIAGERRWRASGLANKPTIRTLVGSYTDLEVIQIQLVENVDRDDLHPYEEAAGIRTLMEASAQAGQPMTHADVGHKLGKSERWVFLRLSLLTLCELAREAFLDEKFGASMAYVIASIPVLDEQVKFTERVLTGFNGEPFTVRQATQYLEKEFMLDLATARFDIGAKYPILVNGAAPPACHQCSKRSGASPDLFADAKSGDLCQYSICFKAKTDSAHAQLLQACRDAGHRIVQGNDARKLLSGEVRVDSGHYVASQPCPELTADKRQLFDIFGATQRGFITIENPANLALVTWVPAKIVKKALKAKGLLRAPEPAPEPAEASAPAAAPQPAAEAPLPAPAPADATAQADTVRPALKPQPLTPSQLQSQVLYRTGALFTRTLFAALGKSLAEAEQPPLAILQLLTIEKLLLASEDARELLREQIAGYPDIPVDSSSARRAAAQRFIAPMTGRELADLLAMLLVAEELSNLDDLPTLETYGNYALALAHDLALDTEAMQEQAEQAAAEQVYAEEDARLGRDAAGKAFAAAHTAAAT